KRRRVYPAVTTSLHNCTLFSETYPDLTGNETLSSIISPAGIFPTPFPLQPWDTNRRIFTPNNNHRTGAGISFRPCETTPTINSSALNQQWPGNTAAQLFRLEICTHAYNTPWTTACCSLYARCTGHAIEARPIQHGRQAHTCTCAMCLCLKCDVFLA
ncbi:unnamed protein product, partial [Ectocarpus sp. 12 AP-2014]